MKKLRIALLILFLIMLFLIAVKSRPIEHEEEIQYNWNNGYCEVDGGRLRYIKVGSKYHYECELCGREYIFDSVMSYN